MAPIDNFIAALESRDCRPRRGVARCPAHEDKSPSLTFRENNCGCVLFDCKTGCNHGRIIEALGIQWRDLFCDAHRKGEKEDRPARPNGAVAQAARSGGALEGKRTTPQASSLPSEDDLAIWREDLLSDEAILAGLHKLRGWTREALVRCEVGVVSPETVVRLMSSDPAKPWLNDGLRRLILPIRDAHGTLVNVELYAPNPRSRGKRPKVFALTGHPRDLYPAPETYSPDADLWIVEGGADAISAISLGLNAVAIPGVGKWGDGWTDRLKGFRSLVICLDCDVPGRTKAEDAGADLLKGGCTLRILDIDPTRSDGYDLGDFAKRAQTEADRRQARRLLLDMAERIEQKRPFRLRPVSARDFAARVPPHNPHDDFLGPLLRRGQRVIVGGATGHGKTTLCLQLISCAAYGERFVKWMGRGNVRCLILDLEQGERSIAKRIAEVRLDQRNGNVQIENIPEGLELDQSIEQRAAVEDCLAGGAWDVVMLDPAYQLVAEEPDDDTKAKMLIRLIDGWRAKYGFCLIVPMHLRKLSVPGQRLTISDIHGRSIVTRNAEVILGVERVKKGEARLHWWKDRDGDLDVPLSSFWRMSFDRSSLFQWLPDEDAEAA